MQFQISTPETVGAYIAEQESRKAKRKAAAHISDTEPSTKKRKSLNGSLPPAPAQFNAPTLSRPAAEELKLDDASLSLAQTQAHNMTDLGNVTKKRKFNDNFPNPLQNDQVTNHDLPTQKSELDHDSLPSAPAPAQVQNDIDQGPTTKKQKLSYANLPPARVRKRLSDEERARNDAYFRRRRIESLCRREGYDYQLFSNLPDQVLLSPNFDMYDYVPAESSKVQSNVCGALEPNMCQSDHSSAENLRAEAPKLDTLHAPHQRSCDFLYHFPAHDAAIHGCPVSDAISPYHTPAQSPMSERRLGSDDPQFVKNMATEASPAFDGKLEAHSCLSDQVSTSSLSIDSTLRSQLSYSSDLNLGYIATNASLYEVVPVNSGRDMASNNPRLSFDQTGLLSPSPLSRDDTSLARSSPSPAVDPPRNKGGRPRTRMPRPLKKAKCPMRFQKNHPVAAGVNVDVWENILLFCPPDFLLKARTVSSTFRSVLNDDSPVWKIARINHFGPDMPDPPAGLSEPQYADLLTGTGCQTRGCESRKARKTYWAFQKRLCIKCFHKAFLPPRALKRIFNELDMSATLQYRSIAHYYRHMEDFLPGMKFDRWDNYQWLGDYDPTPSWGQLYRSGQYTGYPAAAYANFSSELAEFVGNEYDVEHGHFTSKDPLPGKTCPSSEEIDAWFDAKRAANDALVPTLQAVENWSECYKRDQQKAAKELRKSRERFYEEQAELAGLDRTKLDRFLSYQAAIAISKPPTLQSWKILLPKIMVEREATKMRVAEKKAEEKRVEEARAKDRELDDRELDNEIQRFLTAEEREEVGRTMDDLSGPVYRGDTLFQ